jgi:peptidoglycan/xylan/chitin deacetylase (PgdA/CDA1 family)
MYHYVRPLEKTRYADINALRKDEFEYQVNHIEEQHNLISLEDVRGAIYGDQELPPDPALLTFDDGFLDHFTTVFPILHERDIPGVFFPPVEPILHDTVLNVHKIHHILSNSTDVDELLRSVFNYLDQYRYKFNLEPNDTYYQRLAEPGRWDPEEVIFIKRLLQRELTFKVRSLILDDLFADHMDINEKTLSQELYMQPNQLKTMVNAGMDVGSHTFSHRWLETLSEVEQEKEIKKSIDFLKTLGISTDQWAMCYPYGSYNDTTLELLRQHNCDIGFATEVGEATLDSGNALTLQRFDTNDIPQSPDDLD